MWIWYIFVVYEVIVNLEKWTTWKRNSFPWVLVDFISFLIGCIQEIIILKYSCKQLDSNQNLLWLPVTGWAQFWVSHLYILEHTLRRTPIHVRSFLGNPSQSQLWPRSRSTELNANWSTLWGWFQISNLDKKNLGFGSQHSYQNEKILTRSISTQNQINYVTIVGNY